jgi:phosphatidate cytidylyltransferase
MVLAIVPGVCVMGMFGDLSASVLKRNYGVKDYGTLFPEHGGAMDRIDSYLFTMPTMYIIVRLITELSVK